MTLVNISRLREIAEVEFGEIVVDTDSPDLNELRIILVDGSFIDVWFSLKLKGRYSYHWERRLTGPSTGTTMRHTSGGKG